MQEHFNIDNILEHYKSGLLQKWLEVQGLQEELEKINNLSKEDKELISKILDIFEIKYSKEDIKELELSRSYLENKQHFFEKFKKSQDDFNQSLEEYFSEFCQTLQQIIKNPRDKAIIKTNLKQLEENFSLLTLMNFEEILKVFYASPLAILLLLNFEKFRSYLLKKGHSVRYNPFSWGNTPNIMKQFTYLNNQQIQNRLEKANSILFDFEFENEDIWQDKENYGLSKFSGSTNGYWKDLVPKTKKVLVLNISSGSLICAPVNSNKIPKELDSEAVNGKFLILDGLQFKSNDADYSVTYLEI